MNEMTNVTTGEVRFSYAHLFKPYAAMQGQEEKYSVTVLVPKTDADTMTRINAAIEAAKQRGIRSLRSLPGKKSQREWGEKLLRQE